VAVTKEKLIRNLRRVSAECEEEHDEAVSEGRWLAAYESRLTGLIWRAAALAIQQEFIEHRLNFAVGALDLARLLHAEVMAVAGDLEPSGEETSDFRKAEIVTDLLSALLDGVGVMEAWTGADLNEPPFTALRGFALGQAEVALSLAESGHWEQVAKWSSQKTGRPKGSRAHWRLQAAPLIQSWMDADSKISREDLTDKLEDWLKANWHRLSQTRPRPPQHSSLGDILRDMDQDGLIRLNAVPTKGGKKIKTNRL